jgi:DNA-binding transcriptional MerR regulator
MTMYRISEAAVRTGFPASTLRYYEDVGLLVPGRTEAGYRVYDDRAIDRLQFVARAKQLGLQLDEIIELVALWDDDQCAPVATRLRGFVADKLAVTQGRIAEMVAFAAQLQAAAARLDGPAGGGPCGPDCACSADSPADAADGGPAPGPRTAVQLVAKPAAAPPIACTLSAAEMPGRMADWEAVLARAVGREAFDGGLRIRFPAEPELAAELAGLAAAEQGCCSFYEFAIVIAPGATVLDVRAPADAAALVDALFGVAP